MKKYKVVGPNLTDGQISYWHYTDLEQAKTFAEELCGNCGEEVIVCQLIGTYRPLKHPTKYEEEPT